MEVANAAFGGSLMTGSYSDHRWYRDGCGWNTREDDCGDSSGQPVDASVGFGVDISIAYSFDDPPAQWDATSDPSNPGPCGCQVQQPTRRQNRSACPRGRKRPSSRQREEEGNNDQYDDSDSGRRDIETTSTQESPIRRYGRTTPGSS